jgi:hypothetical protein
MPTGQQTSYTNTVPQKRVVSDRILLTDPNEIATISVLGLDNASKFQFANTPGRSYEWLEQRYNTTTLTATASGLDSSSTTTTMSVVDGTLVNIGDVLLLDAEYVHVTGISTNTLTILRNVGGTQATHHTSTVTITVVGSARLEGTDADNSPYTLVTSGTNYSQILQRSVEISATDEIIKRYGIPSLVDREIDMRMDELGQYLARLPYHGNRAVGTASAARMAGGWDTFITTNLTTLSGSPALTQKHLEDAVEDAWSYGGKPTTLFVNSWAKRKIASFFEGSVRTERSDEMGGVTIEKVLTSLGITLNVVVDRFCPATKAYLIDREKTGFITLRDFFYEELAKTGDTAANGQIVGEYGFVVAAEKHHAIISGFSTSL